MRFGTDGVRAKEDYFTEEWLERFASALFLKYGSFKGCIARDTRLSGERIVGTLSKFLIKYGVKLYDCGIAPTPTLAFLTQNYGCDLGIVVSASHNPPEYNGIKLFSGDGAKMTSGVEKELETLFLRPLAPKTAREGFVCLVDVSEYEKSLMDTFGDKIRGMRLLIDACYGATVDIAKRVFEKLGCVVKSINDEPNGKKINVDCGATCLTSLIDEDSRGEYDLAFAYDGDGDRVICVKKGKIYNGDHVVYAYASYLDSKGELYPRMIVGTLNSNLGLEKALESKGISLLRASVGDKHVYKEMKNSGAKVGGESSGHVIFNGYGETGDGIVTSLMLCLMEKEIGLEKLIDVVDYPVEESFVQAGEEQKEAFEKATLVKEKVLEMAKEGIRAIVRASGTEPKIRILVEAERYETAREKACELTNIVSSIINDKVENKNTKHDVLGTHKLEFVKADYSEYYKDGVIVISPETTFIEKGVKIGGGSVIYPFNVIRGKTIIGKNVTVYSYCDLTDTIIGDGVDIRSSYAMQATVGDNSTVGPFATLRKGAVIGKGCRIGNYVEIKNSVLGDGVKSAHLSYVGDAMVGAKTNVGCGTVFANYNGKIKRKTEVGEGVFIGCNTNLIAPLKVGDGSYIAGGSTITKDVPPGKFVISRSCQKVTDKR